MAQITLITGQPGAGKSLLAITKGLEFMREGRPVYVQGFNDVDYEATGFKELPESFDKWDGESRDDKGRPLVEWQKLPRGSVVMLDECYDYMPSRAAGRATPPHIDALARHRHYDIEIILVCQKHDQIDYFVKGLVREHIHVRNKFGFSAAVLKTWDHFESNVKSAPLKAPIWKYPKKNYKLYKSAASHSVKKKLPWYFYAAAILLPLVVFGFWRVVHSVGGGGAATDAPAAGVVTPVQHLDTRKVDDSLRTQDYPRWVQPRVAGQPWTAPAYDQLQPQGVPDLYCMAGEDGRCVCQTEQGTSYKIAANVCRAIARDGIYNPFRKGMGERENRRAEPARRDRVERDDAPVAAVAAPAGYWPRREVGGAYVPPDHQIATQERYQ